MKYYYYKNTRLNDNQLATFNCYFQVIVYRIALNFCNGRPNGGVLILNSDTFGAKANVYTNNIEDIMCIIFTYV